ncbi:hypothetical protein CR513_10788, partial [Mucuna pruriens]
MINDAFGISRLHDVEPDTYEGPYEFVDNMPNEENEEIGDLVRDCNQKLYEGCQKYSKLFSLLRLYHIKCLCSMTDKAMSMILELLKDAFEYANIPNSFFEAKKVIYKLGLNYTKIDVCPRNCRLYWGEDENLEICKHCKKSRWKPKSTNGCKGSTYKGLKLLSLKTKVAKVIHVSQNSKVHEMAYGLLRHPRDAKAWRSKRMLGNNIDVYLQPLIKELNKLWTEGVETNDSSLKELFRMRAVLMWTISYFLGLCTLSGWNTYTGYACPTCNLGTFPC